jgi:hypothetical protein
MTFTTEEAELQAEIFSRLGFGTCAIIIRSLAAERDDLAKTATQAALCHANETARADKLQAENEKLRAALRGLLEWAGPIAGDTQIVSERAYEEETVAAAYAALGEKEQTND